MYRISDREFHSKDYGNEKYLNNWPMLYILENGEQAYVGQSTNVAGRMLQHKINEKKEIFRKVHLIYSPEFNQSVTFDYESKLIQLIAADEQYILTNGNAGIADKNYFNKEYYDNNFKELWERLRSKKIAKHTIDEIVNSDLFKYSPYKELNDSQREAVGEIFRSIEINLEQPIVVNGMPGSGKTIVAVFLFKFLIDYVNKKGEQPYKDKKIALVIPQTSLRKTLKELFKHIHGLKASDVIGPSEVAKTKYDIALVDEAHRLHQRKNITNYRAHDDNNRNLGLSSDATELDWILKQVKCPILFFDSNQIVGPSGISKEILSNKINNSFKNRMITYYTLMTQMRVRGGNDYIEYIRSILDNSVNEKKTFDNYEFKIVSSFGKFEELLIKKENKSRLSRMIAGYAWPWVSKNDKSLKDIKIEGRERMWNNRTENWVNCDTAIEEVGCIHSIQGYDLNYAFVILGNDIKYDSIKNEIIIDASSYYDKKGKATASDEELLEYIKNIYYVLMTRGIDGTYLYVSNPELKKYLSKYIEVIL
jgi:DUF2075 family protein/predicted GIY-YIG superfamily endonuclease